MNIIVCLKQVPDTTEVRIDPVTNTLIRAGVPSIINPDDRNALEQAIRIKEETVANLDKLANETNRSRNELINILLDYAIENSEVK